MGKQQCQRSSTPPSKSTSVPDTNTNEAFALENYSKHVQDSFKASKLLENKNNNNDSNTTASSSSPSFYLAPRSAVSFASFAPSTPAVSAFVPTPETANTTTTIPSASTANTTNNSTITQPTDKDVI